MDVNDLLTKADLEIFRQKLLSEIGEILDRRGKPLKKWLKSTEVRKLLGVSPGKLQTMRKSRILTYTRIGGAIYYEQEDIQKMFEENKVKK